MYLSTFFDISPIFPMPGSGNYMRQPLFVEDFCNIIINCIDMKKDNKIYNITGKEKLLLINLLKKIAKEKKKKILFIKIPLPIFHMMIKVYGLFNRKTKIVPDQLTALTAGDVFPVIAWERKFNVISTKFDDGIRKTINSRYYRYSSKMTRE